MMKYNLAALFQQFGITAIEFDSRKIKAGDAFFAISGTNINGNMFISDAISKGAKLVFTEVNYDAPPDTAQVIVVDNARAALAEAAGILYPKLPQHLVAVTGTNGKTSVVSYYEQIISLLGQKAASVGTLGVQTSCKDNQLSWLGGLPHSMTSPDPITLRQIFNELAGHSYNYVAFEASSHGLEQERLFGIKSQAAAFTSFSQDHLDYHQTMEAYLQAKLKLFTNHLEPEGLAVLNSSIAELEFIKQFLRERNVQFVVAGKDGDLKVAAAAQSITGQEVEFSYQGERYHFHTTIIGSFQADNLAIAALLAEKSGFKFANIMAVLPQIKAVSGRLERVTGQQSPFHVFIDYAHTPDALQNSLIELGKLKAAGKLVVLFGCGGNRDKGKRPLMGAIAAKFADKVIITDDNPRHENPVEIRQQILSGAPDAIEIADRLRAITKAIDNLNANDILLIAGKGHENYQIIGDETIEFSDMQVARECLNNN